MIRVLNILSTITGGGVERRRLSLAKYLDNSKFEMKLIGTHKSGYIAEQIELHGVEIIEVGDFSGPFHWEKHKKVQQIIDDFKPHIIHGAVYEGVTMAAVNGWLKKVPVIILEETSDPQNRSAKANMLLRIFSWTADRFVGIAPNVSDYLIKTAKVVPRKVITINNGVQIPRNVVPVEITHIEEKFGIEENDFVIGTVGRLFNEVKRFTDIIDAVCSCSAPNIKLLIVGGGPDEQLLHEYIKNKGHENRIIMTGYQFDTAPFYQIMDVFCIASQREGFGLVAAEAMLHKLPVIATRVGGLQNVVKDGETGFLIPPNRPQVIAEKIRVLFENQKLREFFGKNGYERAIQNFTEERYVREVEDLYLKLITEKKVKTEF